MNTTHVSQDDVWPYLKAYGSHCLAYSSLQAGLEYFLLDDIGYVPFMRFRHWFWSRKERCVVLANPVCDSDNKEQLLTEFLKQFPDSLFVQVTHDVAEVLDKKGYQVNQFGVETNIDLQKFSLAGKASAKLRQWMNKCQREQVEIIEQPIAELDNLDEVKQLSSTWLQHKGGHELGFLTRPFTFRQEIDVRYFWARQAGKLLGFAVFDPIYHQGEVTGYYHNIDRITADAPHGTGAAIVVNACQQFASEGKQLVSLGMSPLYQLGMEFNFNVFTRKALRFTYQKLNFIYPFQGNASHKNKFNRDKQRVYFCSTRGNKLWEVFVLMKAMNFF